MVFLVLQTVLAVYVHLDSAVKTALKGNARVLSDNIRSRLMMILN